MKAFNSEIQDESLNSLRLARGHALLFKLRRDQIDPEIGDTYLELLLLRP